MKTRGRPSAPPRRHADGGEGGDGAEADRGALTADGHPLLPHVPVRQPPGQIRGHRAREEHHRDAHGHLELRSAKCHGPPPARPPCRSPRRSPAAGPGPRCLRRAARRGTSPSSSTTAAAPAARRWRRRTARRGGPGSALRGHRVRLLASLCPVPASANPARGAVPPVPASSAAAAAIFSSRPTAKAGLTPSSAI